MASIDSTELLSRSMPPTLTVSSLPSSFSMFTVYEGQLIGYSGDTGNCYGAHLHFEVRYKNRRVHPLNWLDADFAAASTAVRLGGYQSVARPAAEKTQPVQMQTVTVGPISNGDAARLYALCGDLGLVESGLYHAAYTEV